MSEAIYRPKRIPKFIDPRITPELDPRLRDMFVGENRTLTPPEAPQPGETRFWIYEGDEKFPPKGWRWETEPSPQIYGWGRGMGLPNFPEKPRLRNSLYVKDEFDESQLMDFYIYLSLGVYIASEKVMEIITQLDSRSVEYIEIDYLYKDDQRPSQRYYMVDFIRRYQGTDLDNSVLVYRRADANELPFLLSVLKASTAKDIPADFHAFLDAWSIPNVLYLSNTLVTEFCRQKVVGMAFRDPALEYPTLTSCRGPLWVKTIH